MRIFLRVLKKYIDLGWYVPPLFYKIVGYRLLVQKHFEEAEGVFGHLLRKHPNRIDGYEGMISVAKKTDKWNVVVERLDMAIKKFPDHFDFVSLQIEALTKTGAIQKAWNLIEKSKLSFPDAPLLALAEAKYLREQFDYHRAQAVLNTAVEKYPDQLELRITQANNYWKLGNYRIAREILQMIRPQLDYKQAILPHQFTIPYIDVLLTDNDLQELQFFFEEAVSAKIRNGEIILGYIQLLVSQKNFKAATAFIDTMIQKEAAGFELSHYALLVFESEKIKNLQSFPLAESHIPPMGPGTKNFPAFLRKIELKLQAHPDFEQSKNILTEALGMLGQFSTKHLSFLNTAVSPIEAYQVALQIIAQIKKKKAFSFIRLGDGEGHFLPYENGLQQFQRQDRLTSQKIWWGAEKIDEQNWQKLEEDYLSAIHDADILGIPGPWRCCRTFLNIQNGNTNLNPEARGLKAVLDLLHRFQGMGIQGFVPANVPILSSCHIHSHLEGLGLWDMVINEIENCSVISCHPTIVRTLKEKHGVTVQKFYSIPSEYKYSLLFKHVQNEENPHYPDRFETICSVISVSYPGEVFLVAAGFLGKFYCNIIKQKGGIALDVGSAADYWLNYKTRVWTKYPNPVDFRKKKNFHAFPN